MTNYKQWDVGPKFDHPVAGQRGITTGSSSSKEKQDIVESTVRPIKMSYTSYEQTKGVGDSDEPIIIMHGLLGSKTNWNSLSKAIHNKTKKKVVAVDARNHGESPHTTELTYNHLAADIKALMDDLSFKKATLIGHSMGGRAVMLVAHRFPELVKELIVVDISPQRTSPNLKNLLKCFEAMRLVKVDPKTPLSAARKSADSQLSKYITDPGLRQFLLTNLVEGEDGKYKWRVNLDAITSNFSTNISNFPTLNSTYSGPTLFIGGTNSDYLLKEEEKEILKLFPRAHFTYIQDAGHWVHSEKPEEFLKLVNAFVQNPDDFGKTLQK
ncbi:hypothetical protein RUM44_013885 [Polyplax serrata]|uniref:sn-1-specific diacylglycerol lipase ABHD11 n=1 Tax=Polyplax serrata TaxID=468196 RepID=A0ABR1BJI4_POLSC